MGKSLQEILGGRNMTGVIRTVASGLPNFLDPGYFSVTKRVVGNKSSFIKVQGERRNAQTTAYGSPAKRVTQRPMSEAGVVLMHAFEEMSHDPIILQNLMGVNGDAQQDLAIEEVDRQTKEFKQRLVNLRLSAVYSILCNGKIYLDAVGNLLYSSSGAAVTIDYSVPSGNQTQISSIIDAPWSTASTDIVKHINLIKKKAIQTTGRPLGFAYYGSNLVKYITTNDSTKTLISQTPVLAEKLYNTGEIPDGFMGLKWRPAYAAFGLNTSEAVTDWWGVDQVTFHPDISGEWWQWQEGSYIVPRDIGAISSDAVDAMKNVDQVYGMFGYGVVSHNPVTVVQYAGDTFIPLLASASDLFIADVTP